MTVTRIDLARDVRRDGPVVLVGPMGAGKSTVGSELAKLLGVSFVDTDVLISSRLRTSVSKIFEAHGEEFFRGLEAATIAQALESPTAVIALGGGAVTTATVRELLRGHRVVWLDVDVAAVRARIGDGAGRPLLEGSNPTEAWAKIAAAREGMYREVATWRVDTSRMEAQEIARAVAARAGGDDEACADGISIQVTGGERPYHVRIGRNLFDLVVQSVPARARKVLIVHQGAVRARAEVLQGRCQAAGFEAFLAEVPDGEEAKTGQVLAFLWQVLGQADVTRSDVIVGLGGGAVTDLAGFAAATWLRGIDVVQVPTTVAGMVDASVGGKTGINTAEGKNLVGAFYPPRAVIADLDALETLPPHDVAAGLAEVVKAGFIADPGILEVIEASPERVLDVTSEEFAEVLERSIRVKAEVVSEDLTEQGRREILNYGHTLGHAIERRERYQWRHGAAVSVGMVFAAELAFLSGHIGEDLVERHRKVLASLGLPTTYRAGQWNALMEAMRRDKKARGATLRFVVLTALGAVTRLEGPDPALLTAAYDAICE